MSGLVVVTDGAGYVGQWCIVEAIRRGLRVRAVAHRPDDVADIIDGVGRHVGVDAVLETIVLDPTSDVGWDAAVTGAAYVCHTGMQPGPPETVTGLNQAIAERVLTAAAGGGVRRVVMTSSVAAAIPQEGQPTADETVWTDPTVPTPGGVAAAIERAARDCAGRLGVDLVTVLPGIPLGPPVGDHHLADLALVGDLVLGRARDVPRRVVELVDVRDVASALISALLAPAASGRYLAPGQRYWMVEVARVLRHRLGDTARDVPTTELAGWKKTVLGWLTPEGSEPPPGTDEEVEHSDARARRDLDWDPRDTDDTLVETAEHVLRSRD